MSDQPRAQSRYQVRLTSRGQASSRRADPVQGSSQDARQTQERSLKDLQLAKVAEAGDELEELKSEYREYLLTFRVSTCQDRCSDPNCKAVHPDKHQLFRRRPVRAASGIWLYLPLRCMESECTDTDCNFAHSTTEVLFHPMLYKTKLCDQGPMQDGNCRRFGPHCPFIHIEKDGAGLPGLPYNRNALAQRPPMMPTLETQQAYKEEMRLHSDSYIELPKSRINIIPQPDTFSLRNNNQIFNRASYKVFPCSTPACKKDLRCLCFHLPEERRRAEDSQYSQQPCGYVYFEEGRGFGSPGKCPEGDLCQFAHTENEVYFHRLMYKKKPCLNYLERSSCPHPYCPFLHERNTNSLLPSPAPKAQSQPPTLDNSIITHIEKVQFNLQRLRVFIQAANTELNRVNQLAQCKLCEKEAAYAYWCGHVVCEDCVVLRPGNGLHECPHCGARSHSPVKLTRS